MKREIKPDDLIPLSKAARLFPRPDGRPRHVSSLHRWEQRGLAGVRLRVRYEGGHKLTCKRWMNEFFDEVTRRKVASEGDVVRSSPPAKKRTSDRLSEAASRLDALGA